MSGLARGTVHKGMRFLFAAPVLALLAAAACGDSDSDLPNLDQPASDAQVQDAGPEDAGLSGPDAQAADAEARDLSADAGESDGETEDATQADAEPEDGATPDASMEDTGPADTGPSDAGGAVDAGPPDGGMPIACNPSFGTTPTACGGNPSGTWTFQEACGPSALEQEVLRLCPIAVVTPTARTATGTLSLSSGNAYTLSVTESITANVNVPQFCALGVGGCVNIPPLVANALSGATASCTTLPTSACDCTISASLPVQDSGTYSTAGSVVTVGSQTYDYCVTGTTLLELKDRGTESVYVLTP